MNKKDVEKMLTTCEHYLEIARKSAGSRKHLLYPRNLDMLVHAHYHDGFSWEELGTSRAEVGELFTKLWCLYVKKEVENFSLKDFIGYNLFMMQLEQCHEDKIHRLRMEEAA